MLLPTGHGKTLVAFVATLAQSGMALVVAPLIALIDDLERRLLEAGIDRVAAIHSGRSADRTAVEIVHRGVAGRNALFVIVAPECLQMVEFRNALGEASAKGTVGLAVVDETHCVSEWGHDFRTAYLRLGRNLRRLCKGPDGKVPPLLALTGTASPRVLEDVLRELEINRAEDGALQRPIDFNRPNLTYSISVGGAKESFEILRRLLLEEIPRELDLEVEALVRAQGADTASGIVFTPWAGGEYGVEAVRSKVCAWLEEWSATCREKVGTYSGKQNVGMRTRTATRFRRNELVILVSTKAFGMGIDKPNIRWTIHLGFPSSIEGFAQEAGRAGRNKAHSLCAIASGQLAEDDVRELLDSDLDRVQRREYYEDLRAEGEDDDTTRQLYFHYNSYRGIDPADGTDPTKGLGGFEKALDRVWVIGELPQVETLWGELSKKGARPGRTLVVSRFPVGAERFADDYKDRMQSLRDKALYRLSLIGVIDDITIDYSKDLVTIRLANYSTESIDSALLVEANRIRPGQQERHERALAGAPHGVDDRIRHHVGYMVRLVYEVIEPARLNALRGMWRLTSGNPDDGQIRRTIAAYLSDGPITMVLQDLATRGTVDLDDLFESLDLYPPSDPDEWHGAGDTWLNDHPDNPVVLIVRAVGEAHQPRGEPDEFARFVRELINSPRDYKVHHDLGRVFRWMCVQLGTHLDGRSSDWCRYLWAIFQEHHVARHVMNREAASILRSPSSVAISELEAVLAYTLPEVVEKLQRLQLPEGSHI